MGKKGIFITFEGIDGCGKSTQVQAVARNLQNLGIPHIVTREPGGTPIAEKIRKIILDPANTAMAWKAELLLYAAARAQHLAEKILPALDAGTVVLCDRYYDATMAYQGYGRGLNKKMLTELHRITTAGLNPSLTLIFDLTVEAAAARMAGRNGAKDRMENEAASFQQKVRRGYRAIARQQPRRCRIIDAATTPAAITETILPVIHKRLARILK